MVDNFLPPERPKAKPANRPVMHSLRLQGQAKHGLGEDNETIGKKEQFDDQIVLDQAGEPIVPQTKRARLKHKLGGWKGWSRKRKALIIVLALLFVGGVAADLYWVFFHSTIEPSISITKHPKPTTTASPLTGVQVSPDLANRPVTGIMIENSLDARPQSGLQDAGVVFEAIAEGGITRFLALFQEAQPQYIGPVRSVRPYYLDWAQTFQASVAHVGGSPSALEQVRGGMRDLDQFFNSGSYWRQNTRAAPHNVYTSFEKLDALNKSKGYTSSKFTPWPRKKDAKLPTPTASNIDLAISSLYYNVHFGYDAASNSYVRSEGGKPHVTTVSAADSAGVPIHPKVVLALVMPYGIAADGQHSVYGDTGSGTAYIFQDGGVNQGTWSKSDNNSQFVFKDASGNTIKLDAGQAWVTILGSASMVSYKP